jgi:hypothetical protein
MYGGKGNWTNNPFSPGGCILTVAVYPVFVILFYKTFGFVTIFFMSFAFVALVFLNASRGR